MQFSEEFSVLSVVKIESRSFSLICERLLAFLRRRNLGPRISGSQSVVFSRSFDGIGNNGSLWIGEIKVSFVHVSGAEVCTESSFLHQRRTSWRNSPRNLPFWRKCTRMALASNL